MDVNTTKELQEILGGFLAKGENTKAVHCLAGAAETYRTVFEAASKRISGLCLGDSDFRVLEALRHKAPLPVNVIGPKTAVSMSSI